MNYTLHQLRIFVKVQELQSITKTSEALHLTQPAISIQLKKFQEQFEVPLFELVGRQLYITPFGEEIAMKARRILKEVESIRHLTMSYQGFVTGELKFALVSTAKYVMPYFLSEFLDFHPGIDLKMDVTNKAGVLKSLERNLVDFAMVSVLPETLQYQKLKLTPNKLFMVGAGKYGKEWSEDIANTPMIYREPGSATRLAMERYLENKGIVPGKKLELTSNEAVKQAVLAGLGRSVMPLIGVRNELENKQLEIIPQESLPITTHWHLIWLKGKQLSPAATSYLDYLKEHRTELSEQHFGWSAPY